MTTYKISIDDLTVLATDEHGQVDNLNATGEPCTTLGDLRHFVCELHAEGAYDADTRDALLAEIGEGGESIAQVLDRDPRSALDRADRIATERAQDWENEATTFLFADQSALRCSGSDCDVVDGAAQ